MRQTDLYEPPVQRAAEALADLGCDVEVICMHHPERPRHVTINGVEITSLVSSLRHGSRAGYVFGYASFFALVTVRLTIRHLRRPYTVVQVNTMPDFLVFAAVIPRLLGARVFLFVNEPVPELAETIYGRGVLTRVLSWVQQVALAFADHAYTVSEELKQRCVERGADAGRITVVLNGADPRIRFGNWSPPPTRSDPRFTLICHGAIAERYGQDTLLEAMKLLRRDLPDVRLVLTGRGAFVPDLLRLIENHGLGDVVHYCGWVTHNRLNDLLHGATVGVVAQKASPYSHLVHTNKMVDYWLFGLPVIASRLRAVSALYDDSVIEYYEAGDAADLARAVRRLYHDPGRRTALARNGRRAVARNGWTVQRERYLRPYRETFASRPAKERPGDPRSHGTGIAGTTVSHRNGGPGRVDADTAEAVPLLATARPARPSSGRNG